MYNMDLIDKFNALLDRSSQAVDDTRRVFSRIEEIIKPEDPKETEIKQFNILAITDYGFSDASFVQMDIKKPYMRALRKRICEYFEHEKVDVTVYFAHHKLNKKCKPNKLNKYVKYLTEENSHYKKKSCNKKNKCKRRKKHRKHCHDDSSDSDSDDDCHDDSSDSDDDSSDSDSDDDKCVDSSDDDSDSEDESSDDKINIKVEFIKYNDLNQYKNLTNNFDKFYIGEQNAVTNSYYKRILSIIAEYKADPANKDNMDTLARLDGINHMAKICEKDLGDRDMKKSTNKMIASYIINENAKMLTNLNIHSIPQKIMLCYVVLKNVF